METKEPTLTAHDRCDKCGAQGWVVTKLVEGELTWCKHHFEKWEKKLTPLSYEIVDERERINKKSESSA